MKKKKEKSIISLPKKITTERDHPGSYAVSPSSDKRLYYRHKNEICGRDERAVWKPGPTQPVSHTIGVYRGRGRGLMSIIQGSRDETDTPTSGKISLE